MHLQKYRLLMMLIVSLMYLRAVGQTIGIPHIDHYSKQDFSGGTQTMEIAQMANGFLVAANNHGLLVFDGTSWACFRLPNQTIVRSIEVVDDRIYCGGQNELGYFTFNNQGATYHSLLEKLPDHIGNIGDVWQIVSNNKTLIIRTSDHFFEVKDEVITEKISSGNLQSIFPLGQSWVYQQSDELLYYSNDHPLLRLPSNVRILGAVTLENDTLLVSDKQGLLLLDSLASPSSPSIDPALQRLLISGGVNACIQLQNRIAFCTQREGIIFSDLNLNLSHAYTIQEGLQRNDVICLYADHHGDYWAGTSNGIDFIAETSPFRYLHPDGRLLGAGYAFAQLNNEQYFGTNNGVYRSRLNAYKNHDFELISGTTGQVWGMKVYNQELFICHHEGLFIFDGQNIQHMPGLSGVWDVFALPSHPNYMIVGHYNGISLIRKEETGWMVDTHYDEPGQSSRILAMEDDHTFWISHPYVGAWRIELDTEPQQLKNVRFFSAKDGFPSDLHIHVTTIAGEVVFTAEKGLYRFDRSTQTIQPLDDFDDYFTSNERFLRLFESLTKQVWYVTEEEAGILAIRESALNKSASKHALSSLKSKLVGGFEFFTSIDQDNLIVGADDGFIHVNADALTHFLEEGPEILVRKIETIQGTDSTVFDALANDLNGLKFDYNQRSLRFTFTSTSFHLRDAFKFQVRLSNFDRNWIDWDHTNPKEYTNLKPGKYVFEVRAISADGRELSKTSVSFSILPPWYMTTYAIIAGVCLFILLMAIFILAPKRKYEREKRAIVSLAEKEIDEQKAKSELEIDKLKNEKLEVEISHKNKELASATMHLVQKGQILQGIRDTLQNIDVNEAEKTRKELRRLVKVINEDIKLDNNWDQFEHHFDQVHVNFLNRLRISYPKLTPNDQKLCAYLRMNLSTKEIATILNISVRGVEISRYRLRKKLGLDTNDNLTDFITRI